jgi:hypothetical protein
MKRSKPTFGHVQMDYHLKHLVTRVAEEFHAADAAYKLAQQQFDQGKGQDDSGSIKRIKQLFLASQRRIEAGVVLLLSATAFLEQVINDYAHTFLEPDMYDAHLDNLRTTAKWMLLPRLCQNKQVSEDDPPINSLRLLLKARNAVAHHRRKEMYLDVGKASRNVSCESDRFLLACRSASSTVEALLNILTSAPPTGNTQSPDQLQLEANNAAELELQRQTGSTVIRE